MTCFKTHLASHAICPGDSALIVQALKDLKKPLMMVLWQNHDALDHGHDPAQDHFVGVAVGVSCFHLLDGGDVLVVRGVKVVQGLECFVERVKEAPQVLAALLGTSLH